MKTSRIAKGTAKIADKVPHTEAIGSRQTRSFAASLQAFSAHATTNSQTRSLTVKLEDDSGDSDSPLSSAASSIAPDIEDFAKSPSLKRKRQVGPARLTSTSIPPITQAISQKEAFDITENDGKIKKARRQLAVTTANEDGKVEIYPPTNWAQIYDAVKEMRKTFLAPVDTMGCERLAEEHVSPRVSIRIVSAHILKVSFLNSILKGQTLPNSNRPNAFLPNQRHH